MPNPGPIPIVDVLSGLATFIAENTDFLQQKVDGKGKESPDADSTKKANAGYGNWIDDVFLAIVDGIEVGAFAGTLKGVLLNGNVTDGTDIVFTAGDGIASDVDIKIDNPTLTLGTGLGSPESIADKSAGGTYVNRLQVAGVNLWDWLFEADEDLRLRRYNGAGAFQDSMDISNADGSWSFPGNIAIGGDLLPADGVSDLGASATRGFTSLVFTERADHVGVATATRAEVWLRSDSPTTLMVTDDAGFDHPLSLMETVHAHATDLYDDAGSGAFASVINSQDMWLFSKTVTNIVYAGLVCPRTYSGNGLSVTLHWAPTDTDTGDVVWEVAIERQAVGHDTNADSFDTDVQVISAGAGTANAVQHSVFTFAVADTDGLVAGDKFRLRIQRVGGDVNDDYDASTQLFDAWVDENP